MNDTESTGKTSMLGRLDGVEDVANPCDSVDTRDAAPHDNPRWSCWDATHNLRPELPVVRGCGRALHGGTPRWHCVRDSAKSSFRCVSSICRSDLSVTVVDAMESSPFRR